MIIGVDASRVFVSQRTGTENYSYRLLREMISNGGANEFILYTRGDDTFKGETLQGVSHESDFSDTFKVGSFKGGDHLTWKKIGWPRLWTQGGLALRTYLDRLDVLFVPAHTLPILRKPGLPTVVTIHGLEYEYLPEHYRFPQKLYLTWSTRYAVRFADRIIAVSQFTADELQSRLGADPKKISVIHEGVDRQAYQRSFTEAEKQDVLSKLGISKPYLLFLGVVQPRKNLERLIEAFSRIRLTGSDPVSLSLVVAGKIGWMYGNILQAPRKYGVEDRVKFPGFVPQDSLPILLQESLAFILPSLTEGFGLPVLEAMAAGAPVIAAKTGALPEVAGDAGLYIDPLSVDDMSKTLQAVISSEEMRKELRKKGLSRVRQFSWDRAAVETLAVLGEVAGKSD
jgi:glycosyltransferase involved in cell wall biosynthesis